MSREDRRWGLGPEARTRLGARVMARRLRAGMSRTGLCSRAAVSGHRLALLEGGKAGASLDVWVRIAGALGVSLDDLLAGVRWVPAEPDPNPGEGSYVVGRGTA